jgi:hypothetical protein
MVFDHKPALGHLQFRNIVGKKICSLQIRKKTRNRRKILQEKNCQEEIQYQVKIKQDKDGDKNLK